MTYKIITTVAGYNALTVTEPKGISFSSDCDTLKYYASGEKVLAVDHSTYDYFFAGLYRGITSVGSVYHGLGYVPYFRTYLVGNPLFSEVITTPATWGLGAGGNWRWYTYADEDYLYFLYYASSTNNTDTYDLTYKYFIYRNNLLV